MGGDSVVLFYNYFKNANCNDLAHLNRSKVIVISMIQTKSRNSNPETKLKAGDRATRRASTYSSYL